MNQFHLFAGLLLGIQIATVAWAEQTVARFTKKPTATKTGENVTIAFAVERETDVAVFIENAQGQIVRHLVAGVLGNNPPPPHLLL